jgi:cyanophycinase
MLDMETRSDANGEEAVSVVSAAAGGFFTGGNQLRITRLPGGMRLDTALHRRHEEGLVIAGTGAGAGMVELGPGLGFLPGVLIDQHCEPRGRLRRLLATIAQRPHELGRGIDEDTALVVHDHTFEVFGSGPVTVIDAGGLTYPSLDEIERQELLAICGVRTHVLPAGYRFDLLNRLPVHG